MYKEELINEKAVDDKKEEPISEKAVDDKAEGNLVKALYVRKSPLLKKQQMKMLKEI